MPRRPTRSVPTVLVPGWNGSGDGHWQTWLEAQLREDGRETRRPAFADLDHPDLGEWLPAPRKTLAHLPGAGARGATESAGRPAGRRLRRPGALARGRSVAASRRRPGRRAASGPGRPRVA